MLQISAPKPQGALRILLHKPSRCITSGCSDALRYCITNLGQYLCQESKSSSQHKRRFPVQRFLSAHRPAALRPLQKGHVPLRLLSAPRPAALRPLQKEKVKEKQGRRKNHSRSFKSLSKRHSRRSLTTPGFPELQLPLFTSPMPVASSKFWWI